MDSSNTSQFQKSHCRKLGLEIQLIYNKFPTADADSYENMESPTSLNSRREGILDPHGEGMLRGKGSYGAGNVSIGMLHVQTCFCSHRVRNLSFAREINQVGQGFILFYFC